MKTLEVILIPLLLYRNRVVLLNRKRTRLPEMAVYALFIIMMMNFECVKNINSYIDQQEYHGVNVMNYPYISIFDEEHLLEYRYSF